jgi:hypothetical protein
MTPRSELMSRQIELAAVRARDSEAADLHEILSEHLARGLQGGGAFEALHKRRWKTVVYLLDRRFQLERETLMAPEDQGAWYTDLVGSVHRIIDGQTLHLLQSLDEDAMQIGGGSLPDSWRDEVVRNVKSLRSEYLKEAEILRIQRGLEASMPTPPSGGTHITLNISHSSVANLNLGTQIGQIESSVGGLREKGLQEVAEALKGLTEAIVAAPPTALNDPDKRQAVGLVASMGEEFDRSPANWRGPVLRGVGAALAGVVSRVDKIEAAYELLKAAAHSQGIELP